MPKINEILLKLEGFHYDTSFDLNMEYYHIPLTENTSNLCIIIFPREKYCYKRLSMGLSNSPGKIQQKMNDLFERFYFILVYIYQLLILTKGYWTDYVHKL